VASSRQQSAIWIFLELGRLFRKTQNTPVRVTAAAFAVALALSISTLAEFAAALLKFPLEF